MSLFSLLFKAIINRMNHYASADNHFHSASPLNCRVLKHSDACSISRENKANLALFEHRGTRAPKAEGFWGEITQNTQETGMPPWWEARSHAFKGREGLARRVGFDFYFPFRGKRWCLGTPRRIECLLCCWQAARQHAHCRPFAVVHMVHWEEFGCSSCFRACNVHAHRSPSGTLQEVVLLSQSMQASCRLSAACSCLLVPAVVPARPHLLPP